MIFNLRSFRQSQERLQSGRNRTVRIWSEKRGSGHSTLVEREMSGALSLPDRLFLYPDEEFQSRVLSAAKAVRVRNPRGICDL